MKSFSISLIVMVNISTTMEVIMAKKRKKKVVRKKKASKKKVVRKKKTVKRKKTAKKKTVRRKAKKSVKKKKRKANPAFMRSFRTTPELKAVIGVSSVSRPHATKKIWEYIRKHKLQDNRNRRQINVGGTTLGKLFPGKRSVTMFDLPKQLSKHLKD